MALTENIRLSDLPTGKVRFRGAERNSDSYTKTLHFVVDGEYYETYHNREYSRLERALPEGDLPAIWEKHHNYHEEIEVIAEYRDLSQFDENDSFRRVEGWALYHPAKDRDEYGPLLTVYRTRNNNFYHGYHEDQHNDLRKRAVLETFKELQGAALREIMEKFKTNPKAAQFEIEEKIERVKNYVLSHFKEMGY